MNESHSSPHSYSASHFDNVVPFPGYSSSLPSVPGWVLQAVLQNMPQAARTNYDMQHLAWRKLLLSKAKLKASSRTSALLSGFAMVAMVEVQLDSKIPVELLIAFAICTTLLVAVHMLALMISTCILPHLEAISNVHSADVIMESPHEKMRYYIEMAWAFSTVFGILLFLCEIALLCWVKFWNYSTPAATSSTILLVPVLVVFVAFAVHFYQKLVAHRYEYSTQRIHELENYFSNLDDHDHGNARSSASPIQMV